MVLSLLLGALGGYADQKVASRQAQGASAAKRKQAEGKYQMELRAANDPRHPNYWGMQSKIDAHQSHMEDRLLNSKGGLQHTMGIEAQLDEYVRSSGGMLPEAGSDSERAALEMAASGLSNEQANKLDSAWNSGQMSMGRAVVGALEQDGLDLGSGIGGKSSSLKRDRYGKDDSQMEFLDGALNEFGSFVPFILGSDPDKDFGRALEQRGIRDRSDEYKEAFQKFGLAKTFWGSGFGAAFIDKHGRSAPQAAQQALDRVGRAKGYWNGKRMEAYAPPFSQADADAVVDSALEKAGGRKSSGDVIAAPPAASSREQMIFPDDWTGKEIGEAMNAGPDRMARSQGNYAPSDAKFGEMYGKPMSPYQKAQDSLPEEMKVAPDFNPQVMAAQFNAVSGILEMIRKNPGEIDAEDLEYLELKLEQGWWPHLIGPALEGFKGKIEAANEQDGLDELYQSMKQDRPKTWMLGGQK